MFTRLTLLSLSLAATSALADLQVHNTLPDEYRIEVTQPNGRVDKRTARGASPAASSNSFIFSPGPKTVPVAVFDDANVQVWKGTASVDDVLVLLPAAKGIKVVTAGTYGSSSKRSAVVFLNATGEALTLDLEGGNGLGAHRGLKPGPTFDEKQAVRLDARESSFKAIVKSASGDEVKLDGQVLPSRHYVIYKNTTGQLKLLMAGTLGS